MRFLADENLSGPSLRLLREHGLDILSVIEETPGLDDADVVGLARQLDRVLITFDSDIGERIFRHGDAPPPGVIYLRFIQSDPEETARVIIGILNSGTSLDGQFITYRNGRIRRQPLP